MKPTLLPPQKTFTVQRCSTVNFGASIRGSTSRCSGFRATQGHPDLVQCFQPATGRSVGQCELATLTSIRPSTVAKGADVAPTAHCCDEPHGTTPPLFARRNNSWTYHRLGRRHALMLPLFGVALSSRVMRPFYAVPRASWRTASNLYSCVYFARVCLPDISTGRGPTRHGAERLSRGKGCQRSQFPTFVQRGRKPALRGTTSGSRRPDS